MDWIKCTPETMPEKDCVCVVWNDSRPFQYYISNYNKYFNEFEVWMIGASRLNDPVCFHATHWMLLNAPKDENGMD